jgi:hypothetical protein
MARPLRGRFCVLRAPSAMLDTRSYIFGTPNASLLQNPTVMAIGSLKETNLVMCAYLTLHLRAFADDFPDHLSRSRSLCTKT